MKNIVNLHNWKASQIDSFSKFIIAHTLLGVKIRVTACSKEKRTWFKTGPKLSYKLQQFINNLTQKMGSVFIDTPCITNFRIRLENALWFNITVMMN